MKDKMNVYERSNHENFTQLLEIQKYLTELFNTIDIAYEEKLYTIKDTPFEKIKTNLEKIMHLLHLILNNTQQITSIKPYIDYMAFENVLKLIIPILNSLVLLLSSNFTDKTLVKFYRKSHHLLKYFWAIRFIMAKITLESIPEYYENQLLFFNMPDDLFDFIEEMKKGPKNVEILAEVSLEIRIHKLLPLLLSRGPDQIALSPLGEKLLRAHTISNIYNYYLYDFEEEVLESTGNS